MINLGDIVEISHGGGGKRMDALIDFLLERISQNTGENPAEMVMISSEDGDDGAFMNLPSSKIIVSTDSHTVDPIFFRGGNLGDLSIAGTVNDLVVMGAKPLVLTLGMIIEEGFEIEKLGIIAETIGKRVSETGISIIAGDTKVMPKGSLSEIVTNTTGIGMLVRDAPLSIANAVIGDAIIVTGSIGDHGSALMALREGIDLDTDLDSDVAPFWPYFQRVIQHKDVHVMKDITRGGLASALYDIAVKSNVLLEIDETRIPMKNETSAICEMLGLEPMEISSEGKAIILTKHEIAGDIVEELRKHDISKDAVIMGRVKQKSADMPGHVHVITEIGGTRILEKPFGEPIPRVC